MLPVCPAGMVRCLGFSGLQTRWAHRLEVYVPHAATQRNRPSSGGCSRYMTLPDFDASALFRVVPIR